MQHVQNTTSLLQIWDDSGPDQPPHPSLSGMVLGLINLLILHHHHFNTFIVQSHQPSAMQGQSVQSVDLPHQPKAHDAYLVDIGFRCTA